MLIALIILLCVAGKITHRRWTAFQSRKHARSAIHSVTIRQFGGTLDQWAEGVVRERRG